MNAKDNDIEINKVEINGVWKDKIKDVNTMRCGPGQQSPISITINNQDNVILPNIRLTLDEKKTDYCQNSLTTKINNS